MVLLQPKMPKGRGEYFMRLDTWAMKYITPDGGIRREIDGIVMETPPTRIIRTQSRIRNEVTPLMRMGGRI